MREYPPRPNTFPHHETDDTYFLVFHRMRDITVWGSWHMGTFPLNSAIWSKWRKNPQYQFVVVASTTDTVRDADFKDVEYLAGRAMSPDIAVTLNTSWSQLPRITIDDLTAVTNDYIYGVSSDTAEKYIAHLSAQRVLVFLYNNDEFRKPVRVYAELLCRTNDANISRELSRDAITRDTALRLADYAVKSPANFREVCDDIIPVMEHLSVNGEPLAELQEALIP